VPLLVAIPYTPTLRDKARFRMRQIMVAGMILMVLGVYGAVFVIKLKTSQ
jgi:hypothetical protein